MLFIMNIGFLSLGGNLGGVQNTFVLALRALNSRNMAVTAKSSLYSGKALGMPIGTPDFINMVCKIHTEMEAEEVLRELLQVETQFGRDRKHDSGKGSQSRTLDLDIIFFNNEIIQTSQLMVPHPRMHLRPFVLLPLIEIKCPIIHPVLEKSLPALLSRCPADAVIPTKLDSQLQDGYDQQRLQSIMEINEK